MASHGDNKSADLHWHNFVDDNKHHLQVNNNSYKQYKTGQTAWNKHYTLNQQQPN